MTNEQLEEIVRKYENKLYKIAYAIMGSKEDAEDVIQDTFFKLLEKCPEFSSPEHETAWLIRVTVNFCKTRLRSYWRKNSEPLHDNYPVQTEEQQVLIDMVFSLPPKYRAVIQLFYYDGYSTKEIAGITKQKETTVRSLLSRARVKLKNVIEIQGSVL